MHGSRCYYHVTFILHLGNEIRCIVIVGAETFHSWPAEGMLELVFGFLSSGALNGMVVCKEAGQDHRDALLAVQ